jgi:phytoene synthase
VARLHARLDAIYAGRPQDDVADRAMACVVHEFAIPRVLPEALIEGFAWDAQGRRYETIDEVHDYGARVAGTVGAMMALIMDTRDAPALARACELGCAMQLTNIARDVGEDARNGRLYLPRQWMREAGLDPDAWLTEPVFDARLAGVIERLLRTADQLYRRAEHGVARLPRDCRPAIQAARLVYAEIGRELERARLDSVSRRAVVPSRRKLVLMLRACSAALRTPASGHPPSAPLPAITYLVEASVQAARRRTGASRRRDRSFDERTEWVLELFERRWHQDRASHG